MSSEERRVEQHPEMEVRGLLTRLAGMASFGDRLLSDGDEQKPTKGGRLLLGVPMTTLQLRGRK